MACVATRPLKPVDDRPDAGGKGGGVAGNGVGTGGSTAGAEARSAARRRRQGGSGSAPREIELLEQILPLLDDLIVIDPDIAPAREDVDVRL